MTDRTDDPALGGKKAVTLEGALTLFGFPPKDAVVRAIPRNRRWRGTRAFAFLGSGLLLTPVVGMVPPHAPWAVGALGFGFYFGIRKWRERFTLESLNARCPKCGEEVALKAGTPLKPTLSVSCDSCHHDSQLTVDIPEEAPQRPGALPPPNPQSPAHGDSRGGGSS